MSNISIYYILEKSELQLILSLHICVTYFSTSTKLAFAIHLHYPPMRTVQIYTIIELSWHILHFTAGWHIRVWYSNSKHPYAYLFKKYYNLSPWKKTPLPLGHLTLKIKVLRNIFKILPFSIYLKILRIKRERAK